MASLKAFNIVGGNSFLLTGWTRLSFLFFSPAGQHVYSTEASRPVGLPIHWQKCVLRGLRNNYNSDLPRLTTGSFFQPISRGVPGFWLMLIPAFYVIAGNPGHPLSA